MKNKIIHITKQDSNLLRECFDKSNYYIVEINGSEIQSKNDLLQSMKINFKLPDSFGWDSFIDWMTDLS